MKPSLIFPPIAFINFSLIIIFTAKVSLTAFAQELHIANQPATVKAEEYTSTLPAIPLKKRFWRAAGEWTMMQLLPWASNRYIRKALFAKISIKSIGHNLNPKNFEWDDNKFFNNQFSHPYQGSLYFNAFRSNGYNFWQSSTAALAGSLAWETIFETHLPAPNDIINTSLGGIAFGEMSSRISKKLLNRKKRNILSAPLSFAINPINTVNYILDRKERKKNETSCIDNTPVIFETEAGLRLINMNGKQKFSTTKTEMFGRIYLQYGDPYTSSKDPFSSFSILLEAGNCDSAKGNTLQIEGSLYGKKIHENNISTLSFNISMNYDFYQNSSFVYSAQSFRANLLSKFIVSDNLQIQLRAGAGIIVLAAVPNPHMYYGEGRNYDYCSGINFKTGISISLFNKLFYDFNCNAAVLTTVNGYSSSHLVYNSTSTLSLKIYKKLSVSVSTANYDFNGYYKDYTNSGEHHFFRHFSVGYKTTF